MLLSSFVVRIRLHLDNIHNRLETKRLIRCQISQHLSIQQDFLITEGPAIHVLHPIDKPRIADTMLPRTSIHPLNPQLSEIALFDFTIAVAVLQSFFDATDGSAECVFRATAVSFCHFDDSFVFFGCKTASLGYCSGG